jgi:hypothetical protein
MAAEAVAGGGLGLEHAVALLGTAVIAAPLFRRLGLGSVLGYLAAGLVIGPFGIGIFRDPEAILHVAELGVVMFIIGPVARDGAAPRFWIGRCALLRASSCCRVLVLHWPPGAALIGASGCAHRPR